MNLEALDITILGPAFIAGVLVVSTHVPLGQQVLTRGIIFIDLAVAQIAGLGVIAAHNFHWEQGSWQVQVAAVSAALIGALLLYYTERRWPVIQEALIGSVFILAATGGILLLAANPHAGEHLKDLLAGQILWVSYRELIFLSLLYTLILVLWFTQRRHIPSILFYLVFAVTVTASVQLVGVFLVFASLIIPALAVRQIHGHGALFTGYALGTLGYGAGLILSALFDLPSGAVIVWTLAFVGLAVSACLRQANRYKSRTTFKPDNT